MKGDSPRVLVVKTQSFYRETPEERESFVSAVEMWRTYWPMTMLREKTGWQIDIVADWIPRGLNLRDPKLEKIVDEIGKKYDIVYSSYWRQAMQESIMQVMCDNHGIKRIMDVDDDLFHLSDWNPLAPTYAKGTEGRMKSEVIVGMAEHLTTTTEPLRKMYAGMREQPKENTHLMPNYAPKWFYQHPGNNRQTALDADFKVVIGWHGSMHHKGDLALIWDAVSRIMDKYPYVHLHTVAEIPQGKFDPKRVKVFNAERGMENWQRIYRSLDFDIGICPLEDTKFNEGKSNIKYQEMALMNAAPVCSSVYPYKKTVTDGTDGLLVKDGKWYDSLERLVTDHTLRRGVAMNAKHNVEKNYLLENNWTKWRDLFEGVLGV